MGEEVNHKKDTFRIFGINIWRVFAYFIIYSILGFVIETIYGAITTGVLESRKSFLYGPFCAIYGLGASIMIIFLHKYYKKYNMLFILGFIIGSIVEYLVSLLGEMIFHVKWWDYSNMPLNINGRICVYYSFFWGILSIYLICSLNPYIDRFIDLVKTKVSIRKLKIITAIAIILLFIDWIISSIAVNFFLIRIKVENDLDVPNKEVITQLYDKIYSNEKLSSFIYKYFDDKTIIRAFPNIKIEDINKEIIYIDSLLPDIQPYYFKIHNKNPYVR